MRGPVNPRLRQQSRLFGAARRQHPGPSLVICGHAQRHGQGTAHRAQLTRQGQLTGKHMLPQRDFIQLTAGGQDADGDGQIKTPRVFGQIGWGQVDDDALIGGEVQAAVLQRRAHPFAGFAHLGVSQAHQGEAGQAVGHVHLDRDAWRFHAQNRAAVHLCEPHLGLPELVRTPIGCSIHVLGALK